MFLTASLESQFWNLKGIIKKTHNACAELFFLKYEISFFWTNISYQLSEDSFHFVWYDEKCFLIYFDWTFFYRVNIWIDKPYLRQNLSLNPGLLYTTYVFFSDKRTIGDMSLEIFCFIKLHQASPDEERKL